MTASRAWKTVAALALLLACVNLALAPFLYSRSSEAINQNRKTVCAIGAFLVGAPLVRVTDISHHVFLGQLLATRDFLRQLRSADCPHLTGASASVTTEAIERQLERIADAIKHERHAVHRRHQREQQSEAEISPGASAVPAPSVPTPAVVAPTAGPTQSVAPQAPSSPPPTGTTGPTGPHGPQGPSGGGNPPPAPPPQQPGLLDPVTQPVCDITGICL